MLSTEKKATIDSTEGSAMIPFTIREAEMTLSSAELGTIFWRLETEKIPSLETRAMTSWMAARVATLATGRKIQNNCLVKCSGLMLTMAAPTPFRQQIRFTAAALFYPKYGRWGCEIPGVSVSTG